MRRLVLAVALYALAALPALALDRNAFSFTRYDLRATLDPHQHGLAVEGTVELRNISKAPQGEVTLQISSSLSWLSVLANGSQVEWLVQPYTSDIDHTGQLNEAILKLAKPVAPGESLRVSVRYSGTVTKDSTRLERIGTPADIARRSDWDEISDSFTALRGVGYVVWYPVSMDAANLAQGDEIFETLRDWRERESPSEMRVRVSRLPSAPDDESEVTLVANGSKAIAGSEITADFPNAADPVVVLINDPAQTTDRPNVEAYYTAAHTNLARDYMSAAEFVIPPLQQWFGAPRRKVVLVELSDPNALPYNADTFYFVPMRPVLAPAAEVALARPVVHSMFESPRPWIREGLAAFAQAMIRERQAGRRAALDYLGQFGSALAVAQAQSHGATNPPATAAASPSTTSPGTTQPPPPGIGPQPLITTADEMFFRTKAAYVWWMLRDTVGDNVLQTAITQYRPAQDRDSAYMQRLIQNHDPAKHDLEAFFDDWVYRDHGLPQFKVDSAYARQTLGSSQSITAVTIQNFGDAGCEVPVSVHSESGENSVRVLIPAKAKVTVRVPFQSVPTEAEVNDGSIPEGERRDNVVPVTTTPPPQ